MRRRDFIKQAGFTAGALAFTPLAKCVQSPSKSFDNNSERPNIIFIMADDHASHALSCYGSKINKTPNLDRLANEGMRFDNCFCTNGICAPSRAVILTGKYSHINGHVNNVTTFDGSQQTFPKLMQKGGYQTAMIGKWHLKSTPTGFDYYSVLPGQGEYYNPDFIEMGEKKKHKGYVTDIVTDKCMDWIKNRDRSKPFCLMYQHKAPHANWKPGPDHLNMYDDVEIPEPPTFNDDYASRSDAARQCDMTIEHCMDYQYPPDDKRMTPPKGLTGQALKKWKYQRYIKDYLRCIASIDDNTGRFLDFLDEQGLSDNTIVIYTSDQGFFLGDHGWYDKRFMYEHSLRMPLLVRYPKLIKPGSVADAMVLNLDFASTFLDMAGIEIPDDIQGDSLRPILEGRKPVDWRKSIYYHFYEYPGWHMVKRHYGVRTQRYKLMHFYHDIDAWELYDLKKDPDELRNVYDDPSYAKIVLDLKAELKKLQHQYGDSEELAKEFIAKYKGFIPPYREKNK
ncbi:MAG: sulfatase [Planctomycetes bacterium]|nr:sulfatase [Planctomycetota bacterium]